MHKARVFVSSTCYDLHQVRRDLEAFIEGLGYEPVLSDSKRLSIPPGLNNIEACKWLVRESDLLVLVIGGRYGSADETGKSITNIEYETAFEEGMPIYTFVEKDVWTQRDSYRRLREMVESGSLLADKLKEALGGRIEDPRVFTFIDQVASATRDSWIREFTAAVDIIESLKSSWSLLLRDMLFERRAGVAREERVKSGPVLELRWLSSDDKELKTLEVPSLAILDPSQVLAKLETLQLSREELDGIERNRAALLNILSGVKRKDLGLSDRQWRPEEIIEQVQRFHEITSSAIQLLRRDSAAFRTRYRLRLRSPDLMLVLANSGTTPAVNPVIYLDPAQAVRFGVMRDLIEEGIYVPAERPKYVSKVLDIVSDPIQLGSTYSALRLQMLEAGDRFGHLGVGGDFFSPQRNPKPVNVTLEDGRVRIDITGSLKHHFTRALKSTGYLLMTYLEEGEIVDLSYKCYADNLPSPTKGVLKLIAVGSDGINHITAQPEHEPDA